MSLTFSVDKSAVVGMKLPEWQHNFAARCFKSEARNATIDSNKIKSAIKPSSARNVLSCYMQNLGKLLCG
jgi:hypothetical protein